MDGMLISPVMGNPTLRRRYHWGMRIPGGTSSGAFGVAGRVFFQPIDIPWPCIIDGILYQVGGTSAGNVRAGIYREGATPDLPNGAALAVESASVAQTTATWLQLVPVANTLLAAGQYFIGLQGDDVTATYYYSYAGNSVEVGRRYDRAGGYGAFTDPCPVTTNAGYMILMGVRVKQNLPAV